MSTTCDVLVVGSGAGGLACATVAAAGGLDVVLAERAPLLGGTAARSGGWLWVPGNRGVAAQGDRPDDVLSYLEAISDGKLDHARVNAFLEATPRTLEFFESRTAMEFEYPESAPDYSMDAPGARKGGRAIFAKPLDARALAENRLRIETPLAEMTVFGVMPQIGSELDHFVRANRSLRSFVYVLCRIGAHLVETLRYRRGLLLSNGSALVGRLVQSAADCDVTMWTSARVERLVVEEGRVVGAVVDRERRSEVVRARRGVVLACGGISHDVAARQSVFSHDADDDNHISSVTPGHDGANLRLATPAGGVLETNVSQPAAWAPVSVFRGRGRSRRIYPHLRGIGLPGIIAVDRHGRRFTNESNSYHDFGQALVRANQGEKHDYAFLVCDARTMHRYGIGYAKPWPMPRARYRWNRYLLVGRTIEQLARRAGIDPSGLEANLAEYNASAAEGKDPAFGRGDTEYNWFRGDRDHRPNPSLAVVAKPPFYATKVQISDLGAFVGLRTSPTCQVVTADAEGIPGLYAVGTAAVSVFGGAYPGYGAILGPSVVFGYLIGQELLSAADPPT